MTCSRLEGPAHREEVQLRSFTADDSWLLWRSAMWWERSGSLPAVLEMAMDCICGDYCLCMESALRAASSTPPRETPPCSYRRSFGSEIS
ncbi:Hypothetical predicted protein [Xyrichtys novacula]|uniref:Uncharacterized protein n=1 Tax=Xyrichtys novacula TaxID=13765 RepID=A0AAV1EN83_XYRNO|nr:Hypothetical predicted protein [Xyrichtys novacula]